MDTTQEPADEPSVSGDSAFGNESSREPESPGTEIPVQGGDEDSPSRDRDGPEERDPIEVELQKWKNLALRSQADLENYRKRMSREKAESVKFANSALLESLMPILDNFNFGLEAARKENPDSVIFQGMEMVLKQMNDFLIDHGVEKIQTEGQAFDPNVHEALSQAPSDDVPEGIIITEARGGYKLKERLLRAAQVVVSRGPEESAAGSRSE